MFLAFFSLDNLILGVVGILAEFLSDELKPKTELFRWQIGAAAVNVGFREGEGRLRSSPSLVEDTSVTKFVGEKEPNFSERSPKLGNILIA